MKDLTSSFFEGPAWFFTGLLIYYVISVCKVFIIWYVQPKAYYDSSSKNNAWTSSFIKALFSNGKLLWYTFKYIFSPDKDIFLIVENEKDKPVKRLLNILNGVTLFLNPYLIFAFIWTLLRLWIKTHFLYDETQIALGDIQRLLYDISKFPLSSFLIAYRNLIFFVCAITCILVPFLYNRWKTINRFKKHAAVFVTTLAFVANVSFFGTSAEILLANHETKLKELEVQITNIHDSIYTVGIAMTIPEEIYTLNEYEDRVKSHVRDSLLDNINKIFDKNRYLYRKRAEKSSLEAMVNRAFRLPFYKKNTFFDNNDRVKAYSHLLKECLKNKATQYSKNEFSGYMSNMSSWNIEKGEKCLSAISDKIGKNDIHKIKLNRILGCIFDYSIQYGTENLFDLLKIEEYVTVKKIVSIIGTESFKTSFVNRMADVFLDIKSTSFQPNKTNLGIENLDVQALKRKIDISLLDKEIFISSLIHENKMKIALLEIQEKQFQKLMAAYRNSIYYNPQLSIYRSSLTGEIIHSAVGHYLIRNEILPIKRISTPIEIRILGRFLK